MLSNPWISNRGQVDSQRLITPTSSVNRAGIDSCTLSGDAQSFLKIMILCSIPLTAMATDFRLEIRSNKDPSQEVISDVPTLVKNGYMTPDEGKKSQAALKSLISMLRDILLSGPTLAGKSTKHYADVLSKLTILFDQVPKMQGFGPIACLADQCGAVQFYNRKEANLVVWPLWSEKVLPLSSDLLPGSDGVPGLNRGIVMVGLFLHELISVAGEKDLDYNESVKFIWANVLHLPEDTPSSKGPQRILLAAGSGSDGGASVGGGGNDHAFALKLLFKAILLKIMQNSPDDSLAKIRTTWSGLPDDGRDFFRGVVDNLIIEEAPCKTPVLPSGELASAEILQKITGESIIRLCQGPAIESIVANLKTDPKYLDKISMILFDNLLSAVIKNQD